MTILILGASRGIGHEFARQYRAAGERVIGTARNAAGLQALAALGAAALQLDVAQPSSIGALGAQLAGEKIDLALYVAGVNSHGGAGQPPSPSEFDHTMHTNVLGAMQAIPQVAPLVEAAGGKFVFISSRMGRIADADSSYSWVYRASKAALNMAVVAAQPDYPQAIFVALNPGWVRTDMGGAGAPLALADSVAAMRATIAGITRADQGRFLNHDGQRFEGW